MMIELLIKRYKDSRSRAFLSEVHTGQYAFVGIGGHSLTNLYPVLHYLQVPLKYICCRSADKAVLIERKYKGVRAVTSLDEILKRRRCEGSSCFRFAKGTFLHCRASATEREESLCGEAAVPVAHGIGKTLRTCRQG